MNKQLFKVFSVSVIFSIACSPDKPKPEEAIPVASGSITGIEASSSLKEGVNIYHAENLLDGNSRTSWVEGVDGDGIGEQLRILFERSTSDKPAVITAIEVINGFTRNYKANNRVKEMTLSTDSGSVTVTLKDSNDPQTVSFSALKGRTLTLTIDSVYKGTKYQDTALSEISLPGLDIKAEKTAETRASTQFPGEWVNEGEQTRLELNTVGRGKLILPGEPDNPKDKIILLRWSADEGTLTLKLSEQHPWLGTDKLIYTYKKTDNQQLLMSNGTMAFLKF